MPGLVLPLVRASSLPFRLYAAWERGGLPDQLNLVTKPHHHDAVLILAAPVRCFSAAVQRAVPLGPRRVVAHTVTHPGPISRHRGPLWQHGFHVRQA